MENKLNWQITNNNGMLYTVICQNGDKAILLGGNDYVVIQDLSNFRKLHTWCGGEYFPHFNDLRNNISALNDALEYFKLICGYNSNENIEE